MSRLRGIWIALGVMVAWTVLCVLAIWYTFKDEEFATDAGARLADYGMALFIGVVWLVVVVPTLWAINRSRYRH